METHFDLPGIKRNQGTWAFSDKNQESSSQVRMSQSAGAQLGGLDSGCLSWKPVCNMSTGSTGNQLGPLDERVFFHQWLHLS
jgi:hypothetical protein